MFISSLKCPQCGFTTENFVEGFSIHEDAYTWLYRNTKTNEIRVVRISREELEFREIDTDSDDFDEVVWKVFSHENEVNIDLPWGQRKANVCIPCPQCGATYITKIIEGIE